MFVLPNLFTVSSVFCGFYAMAIAASDPSPAQLYRAAVAIFFAMFFDMFDGRVARLTKTQSEFGMQLDSLADALSFGAAPALLLFKWCLADLGASGLFVSFAYVACAVLRLARFNVIAAREKGSSKYFVGLPTPLAAGTVVALVMASFPFERPIWGGPVTVAVVTMALAGLMVSNVHYRTFKDLRPSRKSITLVLVLAIVLLGLSAQLKPTVALAALCLGYICVGLAEEALFFRKRLVARREDATDEDETEEQDDEFEDADDEEPLPSES